MADPAFLYRGLNCLGRFDCETKKLEIMSPGPDVLVQEPCFSPRNPEAPEGDGFLITMIDNIPKLRNEVVSLVDRLTLTISSSRFSLACILPTLPPSRDVLHADMEVLSQIIQDTKDFHTIVARILLPFRTSFPSSIAGNQKSPPPTIPNTC